MLEERERESNFDLVAQENYFFKTRNQFEKFTNSFLGQQQQQHQQQPPPNHHRQQLNPHQLIDSTENSLFNPEEAQFFDNFLNNFIEETAPFDGQMQQMRMQNYVNYGLPQTNQMLLQQGELLNNDQFHQNGNSSASTSVSASGLLITDPRLQEAQRNNYAALNISSRYPLSRPEQQLHAQDQDLISSNNHSSTTIATTANSSFSDNTIAGSAFATEPAPVDPSLTATKKRGRSRKSAADKPPKPTKAPKTSRAPPLAPLIVSNLANSDNKMLYSANDMNLTSASQNDTTRITDPPLAGKTRSSRSTPTPRPDKELLTDEQKKTNHVLSEQRRRALIKEGFELLESLTPSLAGGPVSAGPGNTGGGHSKSAILFAAARHIQDLEEKIRELQA